MTRKAESGDEAEQETQRRRGSEDRGQRAAEKAVDDAREHATTKLDVDEAVKSEQNE